MSVEAVRSKQPRDFDPVNFTVVPPRTRLHRKEAPV
jgi:hypothetical protein